MGLTKRQEVLIEVLSERKGEWIKLLSIATLVNIRLFNKGEYNERYVINSFDKRNPCPEVGTDQRAINSDMDNDYIIITSHHSFMIMPSKTDVEREIIRYYKIALAKLKRAREFIKKANKNGQYDLLNDEYRRTLLNEIHDL